MIRLELVAETIETDHLTPEVVGKFTEILVKVARMASESPDAMASMLTGPSVVHINPHDDNWRVTLDAKGEWDDVW